MTLKKFEEFYTSPSLLDIILAEKCKLTINCAREDLEDLIVVSEPDSLPPTSDTTSPPKFTTQKQIQSMIRAFRSAPYTASSVR